jgi:hypothetical protein
MHHQNQAFTTYPYLTDSKLHLCSMQIWQILSTTVRLKNHSMRRINQPSTQIMCRVDRFLLSTTVRVDQMFHVENQSTKHPHHVQIWQIPSKYHSRGWQNAPCGESINQAPTSCADLTDSFEVPQSGLTKCSMRINQSSTQNTCRFDRFFHKSSWQKRSIWERITPSGQHWWSNIDDL